MRSRRSAIASISRSFAVPVLSAASLSAAVPAGDSVATAVAVAAAQAPRAVKAAKTVAAESRSAISGSKSKILCPRGPPASCRRALFVKARLRGSESSSSRMDHRAMKTRTASRKLSFETCEGRLMMARSSWQDILASILSQYGSDASGGSSDSGDSGSGSSNPPPSQSSTPRIEIADATVAEGGTAQIKVSLSSPSRDKAGKEPIAS